MQFQNRDGNYNKAFIWYNAAADDCKPYVHLALALNANQISCSHGTTQRQGAAYVEIITSRDW